MSKPEYIFNQRWTADNKDSKHPRAWDGYDSYNRTSSYHMRDASYIRLKNLELGYNLSSAKWISANMFKKCRIYVSGRNLWTLDHIKYFDPEVPYDPNEEQRGSRGKYYFQTVTFNMGLNITL